MLELWIHAKHLSLIRNAIFHITLFEIFSQTRHHVAGPFYTLYCGRKMLVVAIGVIQSHLLLQYVYLQEQIHQQWKVGVII